MIKRGGKILTTIYLSPEQYQQLRLLSKLTKVPVAIYVREGIDHILQQYAEILAPTKEQE